VNNTNGTGLDRVPSGIAGLDTILSGGFLKGGLYIVQGTPGTGKTTLANQIAFNHITAGGRALYTTLLAEYHSRMMQHLGGMSFFDASKIPDQLTYISGFGVLRKDGPKGLLDVLRREIVARGSSVLILDGFASARRSGTAEQDVNEFFHELQAIAIATGCTAFLLTSAENVGSTPEYTMVDGILELSDHLFGWSAESALQVVKLRGSAYLRGRHAFRITDDGLVVYPRIEALLARPSRAEALAGETVTTGVEWLDKMLQGGFPATSTTMLMGPAGIGKTTLGLQFLAACSETAPGLLFGFYETPARIDHKVNAVCEPLRGLLDSGVVEILWQPPTDGLIDAYGMRLLDAIHRRGVRRLFIDGLGAFQNPAKPERMGHFMTALMNELRVLGVTTVYTLEVPDIIGPYIRAPISDLSNLAENLISLRYVELRSRLHRLISILKVRDSNFDPSLYQFALTDHGMVIETTVESAEAITADLGRMPQIVPGQTLKPPARDRG
jgi:circadian clock protein KaiC